jgi:hypothetical protein
MTPSRLAALVLTCFLSFTAKAADLTVSAAASLTNAFNEIGPAFEAANPGNKAQFNYGASGALLQQIAGRAGRCVCSVTRRRWTGAEPGADKGRATAQFRVEQPGRGCTGGEHQGAAFAR